MSTSAKIYHNHKAGVVSAIIACIAIFLFAIMFVNPSLAASNYAYMDDANKSVPAANPQTSSIHDHRFPRVFVLGIGTPVSASQYGKYHQVSGQGWEMEKAARLQQTYPDVQYLRQLSPRAYQGYAADYCRIGSNMAFEGTGPVTQGGPQSDGCNMYAGHWLYQAGTTLTQSIDSTAKVLKLESVSNIQVGQYVVIYDAPAGSFRNAEHAKVASKNIATKTITLQSRGYKSNPKSHSAGAIVAQHVRGQGPDARLWAYNLSTQSPKDGAGKTAGQAMAEWIKKNYNKSSKGRSSSAVVSGIVFDADPHYEIKNTDANNDLITDRGVSPDGENWWGDGLSQFYALVRTKLPQLMILGGTPKARGFGALNGTQMESWPVDHGTNFHPNPTYNDIDTLFSTYRFHSNQHEIDSRVVHNLTKNATMTYPESGNGIASSNKSFRFALGLTLLDNGYFGRKTTDDVFDPWYDEFAVDVDDDSDEYGTALSRTDVEGARQHRGWLGSPSGPYQRVYDDSEFGQGKSMVANGSFDININDWKGNNVGISRVTSVDDVMEGTGALRISKHTHYRSNVNGAGVQGQKIPLIKGNWYTLAFSAKASSNREIKASVGSSGHKLLIGTDWHRYVISFKAKSSGDQRINFSVGRENTNVWLDSIYVFEGNANVFRRDFENGIVVVNSTPTTQTVDLDGIFQRINGTQSAVNDGSLLSQLNLPAYDAAILVRPQDAGDGGGGSSAPVITLTPDVMDSGSYGSEFGSNQHHSGLTAVFENTGGDLSLSLNGYDIDSDDEIAVYLNQEQLGYLTPGSEADGFNVGDKFEIPVSQQTSGTNTIEFRQKVEGEKWGVKDLLLATQVSDHIELTIDTMDLGSYGNNFGSNLHKATLGATFENVNWDLEFSVLGYDIDISDEVSVFLNGGLLGRLSKGLVNNSLNLGDTFSIPVSQQISGVNTIEFRQKTPGWSWGVTDMLLSGFRTTIDVCGIPNNYNPAMTTGVFIWKDCASDQWSIRVSGGGETSAVSYSGSVISDIPMDSIVGFKVEEKDKLTISNQNSAIDYSLKVIRKGEDGIDFKLSPSAAYGCIPLSQDDTTYVGKDAIVIDTALNLLDPGTVCQ